MRIDRPQTLLPKLNIEALLIENPIDIFYLVGVWFSAAQLVITEKSATLLLDRRYFDRFKNLPSCKVVLAGSDVLSGLKRVGFDSSFTSVDRLAFLQTTFPQVTWHPVSRSLKHLRAIKDASEIAALKKAAQVTKEGYLESLKHLKEGVSEEEIAFLFEMFCRKKGASKLSFEPIVAFGENSAYPHYRAGKARLKKNQIVLLDLGAAFDDYYADMTRVFFFGEVDPKLVHFQELVKKALLVAEKEARPGVKMGELQANVKRFYMKEGVDSLFTHGLGHGIGLEAHEFPILRSTGGDVDTILEIGMVFTIEPGLYLPGLGGIRLENTYLMTKDGLENFYGDI